MAATKTKKLITPEIIRELLDYDPETGVLTWKRRADHWFNTTENRTADKSANKWNGRFAGKPAFTTVGKTGYPHGAILATYFDAHRVIVAWMLGRWPKEQVDHINGIRSDNRWSNLREVTRAQNLWNMKSHADSSSKYVGVAFAQKPGKWMSYFQKNGKKTYLGFFDCEIEAAKVRDAAAKEAFGEYARLNFP